MCIDAVDERVAFFFLESQDTRTWIHLEFRTAAFSTMCWKLPKNEASIDKSRTEKQDKRNREMKRFY